MKLLRSLLMVVFFMMALTGTAWAISAPKDVMVIDNGKTDYYLTRAETIEEFLNENEITLEENDQINPTVGDKILPSYVTKVVITRGFDVEVHLDGTVEKVSVSDGTLVGTLVKKFEDKYKKKYHYAGRRADELTEGQIIELTDLSNDEALKLLSESKTDVTKVEIPYETTFAIDENLPVGTIVVSQHGVNGSKEVTSVITQFQGKVLDVDIVDEKVVLEPVSRIITQGTKEVEKKQEPSKKTLEPAFKQDAKPMVKDGLNVKKQITMNASAYSLSEKSTGKKPGMPGYGITASGLKAQKGVVAVDPDVIPLGTRLYIEGYGSAVAGDTGSAIKGNKIDLFLDSHEDCINFGRKNITVYILEE